MHRQRTAWPTNRLSFGGDYNPEQWTEEVWREDIRLMTEARVNLVTVGVFSWGSLEPEPGDFDFGWLDRVLGMLGEAGIGVDLATPTASPPVWLLREHPDILPVTRTGERLAQGGRLGWCPSHPVWRAEALRITRTVAERYRDNPALRLWHIGNEFGGGNRRCYCDISAVQFSRWLEGRYGSIDELNRRWGTAFWGHRYRSFGDVLPPRDSGNPGNPSLVLDFDRFSSNALLEHFRAEREVLHDVAPDIPATTNFMVGRGPHVVDYARWAPEMDLLANDHYVIASARSPEQDLAYSADRMRGFDPRRPWLLMEHSTSAVSWQPRNLAKRPGQMLRNSLSHIARGSDGAMFFQWRQSLSGAEQFHSAMVPHAGTGTRVWREVLELGRAVEAIAEVQGAPSGPARVALLVDDEAGWAWEAGPKPHQDLVLTEIAQSFHRALWRRNIAVDVVPVRGAADGAVLDGYELVLVPGLFLVSDETAARLAAFAASGGRVVVSFLSGIVDGDNRVRPGGYPGAFTELLGVSAEEFVVIPDDESVELDGGWRASTWSERLCPGEAQTVAAYRSGDLAGLPAVTRNAVGEGAAWYVSAWLDDLALSRFLAGVTEECGILPIGEVPEGVELVRRRTASADILFVLNHRDDAVRITTRGRELLRGLEVDGVLEVGAGGSAVVREQP
ncbi:beta-galactosidase [Compostimonas suwonensis]|uniref:Beta-galactosidase n=1 Tax=Compostimonas suwonensis TaxID=1048394 RepID=A0A2M9BVW2_9MICO|nr:beta-galactosidase [Compostimonas suwonensis]PJJ62081.1 beta-galactosidase [Compostimonas suwonensis]